MVLFLPHKQSFFRFIGQRNFGSRGHKLRISSGIYIRTFTVLLYITDIPQALPYSHTYLHTDDASIFYQHKYVAQIENVLNKEFANVCELFVDNNNSCW